MTLLYNFAEGVVSYGIPQGMVRGSTLELMDHTYDGKEDPRTGDLRGGLGQLVDGHYGLDNFKAGAPTGKGVKGYEWLGWKKKTNQVSVNLVFAFDVVRTFGRVDIHANNHFTKDIQVFRKARVYFSNEEDKFGDDRAVDFSYMPDLAIERARNVSINLKGEHGKYVMLQLFFNAKWILISEVTFYSEPKVEKLFVIPKINLPPQVVESNAAVDEVEIAPIDINIETYPAGNPDRAQEDTQHSSTVGIVIGVLLTVILLLLMGISLVMHRTRATKEKRSTPTHSLLTTSTKCERSMTDSHQVQYTPYSSNSQVMMSDKPIYEETIYEEPLNCLPPSNATRSYVSAEDLTDEYAEPGGSLHISHSLSENIYAQAIPPARKEGQRLPPLPLSHYARPLTPPNDYEQPLVVRSYPRRASGGLIQTPSSSSASESPTHRHRYGKTRRSSKSSRTSTLKRNLEAEMAKLYAQVEKTNEVMPFKRSASIDTVNVTLNEVDLADLKVQEKLGEGQFGEIHLCQLQSSLDLVAVKFLRRNCDQVTRSDFEHEARILSSLRDPNLVRVLGVSFDAQDEERLMPVCMVCEYTPHGDLCQFLQDHVAETTLSKSPNVPTLR